MNKEFDFLALLAGLGHDFASGLLKDADEFATNDLALGFRVTDISESFKEAFPSINNFEFDTGGRHIVTLDLFGFTLAQQTMVNKYARELIPHRFVHDGSGYR
ncbi:unannotated protein [freshwater metagenome]|uniref:Unannotated protein n=1 Tax=freshwater metagenome TaxID=449393 RepID=A0A6J6W0X3_9ZZZZ